MTKSRLSRIHLNRHSHNRSQHLSLNLKTIRQIPDMSILPEKAEAARMQAEREVEQPCEVWKVAQWKHDVDPTEPWWRRFYFHYVFLPFLNFSFKLGIPAVKEVVVESDKKGRVRRTFRWFEDQAIYPTEEQANAGCLGERWGYTCLPFGRLMPPESAQYSGTIFPRKKGSRKWAKPTLSLVIKDRKQEEREKTTLAQCLNELNRNLDRALDRR